MPCDWHFVIGALRVNVLIACLKSLPQRIQTPDSLSTRWLLLWRREDLSWRGKPRRTTRTILFSCKFKGWFSSSKLIYKCSILKLIWFQILSLPFRFLYDENSMEYLYYKKRVARLRKDFLRPENTSDNGEFLSSHTQSSVTVVFVLLFLSEILQKRKTVCHSLSNPMLVNSHSVVL